VNSLALTEKQQEVVWLRYDHQASIDQIAAWLHISRRAVLARLRNARRRTAGSGLELPRVRAMPARNQRLRTYPASQLAREGSSGEMRLEHL
jgi:Sigma-70, region 4